MGNGQVSYQFPVWLEKNWGDWSSYGSGWTALNAGGGYALTSSVSFIFTFGHSFAGASHALAFVGLDCEW